MIIEQISICTLLIVQFSTTLSSRRRSVAQARPLTALRTGESDISYSGTVQILTREECRQRTSPTT